jgi:ADP-heptose:LPS heptosyltransferase
MKKVINAMGQAVKVMDFAELQALQGFVHKYERGMDLSDKRLVVRHTWGIGDTLFATPVVKELKRLYPTCKIAFASSWPDVLKHNPDVDDILPVGEFNAGDWVHRFGGHIWVLDFNLPGLKDGRVSPKISEHLLELLRRQPAQLNNHEREFITRSRSLYTGRYKQIVLDAYCERAGVNPEVKTVYYYPTDEELQRLQGFISGFRNENRRVIVLSPSSSSLLKDYPYWNDVIRQIPITTTWLLVGNPHDRWPNPSKPNVIDLRGALKLRESAALTLVADLLCCSDTGLLYVRASKNLPCIALYGPHEPEAFLKYFPSVLGLRSTTVCSVGCGVDAVACSDSTSAPCMTALKPELVAAHILQVLDLK